jgi:hypothetical protein
VGPRIGGPADASPLVVDPSRPPFDEFDAFELDTDPSPVWLDPLLLPFEPPPPSPMSSAYV